MRKYSWGAQLGLDDPWLRSASSNGCSTSPMPISGCGPSSSTSTSGTRRRPAATTQVVAALAPRLQRPPPAQGASSISSTWTRTPAPSSTCRAAPPAASSRRCGRGGPLGENYPPDDEFAERVNGLLGHVHGAERDDHPLQHRRLSSRGFASREAACARHVHVGLFAGGAGRRSRSGTTSSTPPLRRSARRSGTH